jgi:hypothetical protein
VPDFDRRLAGLRARLEEEDLSVLFLPESADLEYLTDRAARTVGVDGILGVGDRLPLVPVEALREALPRVALRSAARIVLELWMSRDDKEIQPVREAGRIAGPRDRGAPPGPSGRRGRPHRSADRRGGRPRRRLLDLKRARHRPQDPRASRIVISAVGFVGNAWELWSALSLQGLTSGLTSTVGTALIAAGAAADGCGDGTAFAVMATLGGALVLAPRRSTRLTLGAARA